MTWKPKYSPDPPKRSFDVMMALIVVLAIVVLGFGLDRVVRYVTGESRASGRVASSVIPNVGQSDITIVDGNTVRSGGVVYRLFGFDTPEHGDRALCDKERDLAEKASARLHRLIVEGQPTLERVACACKPGTEGTRSCNFGRSCAYLKIRGQDIGDVLIREGLAQPLLCGQTSCPSRRPWC